MKPLFILIAAMLLALASQDVVAQEEHQDGPLPASMHEQMERCMPMHRMMMQQPPAPPPEK